MQVLGWILLIILIAILLIPFTTLSIRFQYRKRGADDHVGVTLRWLGGLVRLHYSVPKLSWTERGDVSTRQVVQTGKGKTLMSKRKRISLKKLRRFQKNAQRMRRQVRDLHGLLRRFFQHVTCERLEWVSTIGTGDSAETGILTGVAWALKTALVSVAGRYVRWARSPRLDIHPSFERQRLESDLVCIVRFRLGHLILAVARLYLNMRKGSEGTWQNTPFRAS